MKSPARFLAVCFALAAVFASGALIYSRVLDHRLSEAVTACERDNERNAQLLKQAQEHAEFQRRFELEQKAAQGPVTIKLPDGQTSEDIPRGTTRAQLAERLRRNGVRVSEDWVKAAPNELVENSRSRVFTSEKAELEDLRRRKREALAALSDEELRRLRREALAELRREGAATQVEMRRPGFEQDTLACDPSGLTDSQDGPWKDYQSDNQKPLAAGSGLSLDGVQGKVVLAKRAKDSFDSTMRVLYVLAAGVARVGAAPPSLLFLPAPAS